MSIEKNKNDPRAIKVLFREKSPYHLFFKDPTSCQTFVAMLLSLNEAIKETWTRPASRWVADEEAEACMRCETKFTVSRRRHHCRACGHLVCNACSQSRALISHAEAGNLDSTIAPSSRLRVCDICYQVIHNSRINTQKDTLALSMDAMTKIHSHVPLSSPTGRAGSQAFDVNKRLVHDELGGLIPPSSPAAGFTRLSHFGLEPSDDEDDQQNPNQGAQDRGSLTSPLLQSRGSSNGSNSNNNNNANEPAKVFVDSYGFLVKAGEEEEWVRKVQEKAAARMSIQRQKWADYLVMHTSLNTRDAVVKKLVRAGIPPEMRGRVWLLLSGASEKRAAEPATYYQDLLKISSDERTVEHRKQIEKDLLRTFPQHLLYKDAEGEGIHMLRRILSAYAARNSLVGYCQSLNFIVGLFLLFMDEEEAFWMLAAFVEEIACVRTDASTAKHHPPDPRNAYYHQNDLAGLRIDQEVFLDLVREKLPRIDERVHELGVPLNPLTANWFLCLFVHTLPLEAVLRLWDCLFAEGIKILFRAGLCVLKSNEQAFFRAQNMDQMMTFLTGFSCAHIEPDDFIKQCFSPWVVGSLSKTKLRLLRLLHREAVESGPHSHSNKKQNRFKSLPPLDKASDSGADDKNKDKDKSKVLSPRSATTSSGSHSSSTKNAEKPQPPSHQQHVSSPSVASTSAAASSPEAKAKSQSTAQSNAHPPSRASASNNADDGDDEDEGDDDDGVDLSLAPTLSSSSPIVAEIDMFDLEAMGPPPEDIAPRRTRVKSEFVRPALFPPPPTDDPEASPDHPPPPPPRTTSRQLPPGAPVPPPKPNKKKIGSIMASLNLGQPPSQPPSSPSSPRAAPANTTTTTTSPAPSSTMSAEVLNIIAGFDFPESSSDEDDDAKSAARAEEVMMSHNAQGTLAGNRALTPKFWPSQQGRPSTALPTITDTTLSVDPKFAGRYAGLTRHMRTLEPAHDFRRCAECGHGIQSSEPSLFAMDKIWHVAHFKCAGRCGKRLVGRDYYTHEQFAYCKDDYLALHGQKCGICSKYVLTGIQISGAAESGGKSTSFHRECVKCAICGKTASEFKANDPFYSGARNQFFCCRDYLNRKVVTCTRCAEPITTMDPGALVHGKMFHDRCFACGVCKKRLTLDMLKEGEAMGNDGVFISSTFANYFYCGSHLKPNGNGGSPVCQKCKEPLTLGPIVETPIGAWHTCCCKCTMCAIPLDASNISALGKQILCRSDMELVKSRLPICKVCTLPISEAPVVCKSSDTQSTESQTFYHRGCFNCSTCKTPLVGGNGEPAMIKDGKIFCKGHAPIVTAKARPAAASRQKSAAQAGAGSTDNCAICQKPVEDGGVMAKGKKHHQSCLRCAVCDCSFPKGAAIFAKNSRFYCKIHYTSKK